MPNELTVSNSNLHSRREWMSQLSWWNFLKWRISKGSLISNSISPGSVDWHPNPEPEHNEIRVSLVNHATVLIEVRLESGRVFRILTDPVWSEHIGPLPYFFSHKRLRPPGIPFGLLPKIDLIVVSHNHYDHLDGPTIRNLAKRYHCKILVPLGDESLVTSLVRGHGSVESIAWWESRMVDSIEVTFTPAKHWSGRSLKDHFQSLWGGFLLSTGSQKIFFAGDTAYARHFQLIRARCGPPDVALLPIGAYSPRWLFSSSHMSPAEAILAHQDLGARYSFGIHHGTFRMTAEDLDDPASELNRELLASDLGQSVFALRNGETFTVRS